MLERLGKWSPRDWGRAILIATVIAVVLFVIVKTARVLVPFLLGLLIAAVILPIVDWLTRQLVARLHRPGTARLLAILIVYAIALGLIASFFLFLIPIVVAQVQELAAAQEEITRAVQDSLRDLQQWFERTVPVDIQDFVRDQIAMLLARLREAFLGAFVGATTAIGNALFFVFGLVIIPVWLIYVLYDAERFGRGILSLVPESGQPDLINVGRLFDDVVIAYVASQLFVAAIIGALTGLGLALVGVDFAVLLGLITAIGDLIPTLGPILAAIPTVIIAALERPILALWAVLVLIGVQQFEGLVISPRIVGDAVRLSPAIIIVLLVIGAELFGFLGLLLIVPIAALLRDIVRYFLLRTSTEISPAEALQRVRRARRGDWG